MFKTQADTGPTVKNLLNDAGIDAQQVTLKRDSGLYVAEFYHNKMQTPTKSAKLWAELIEERLPQVEVIDCHDTVAAWRIGAPVIWASVTFKVVS